MNRLSACLLSLSLAWCSPVAMALSVFDVIELTRDGYDEPEIERLIEVTNARFVIDVDGLLALGEANVADEIITLMLDRGGVPAEEPSEADQLIRLRDAGFSEETILQFVRHKNVCEPLADEDARRLGQAGFSGAFMQDFRDQVEVCREERETLALVEPVPEEAYEEAPTEVTRVYRTDGTVYPATYPVRRYPTTTYYPPRYYGIYDSYYYHDRITRVYPIVVYRDYSGHKHRRGKSGDRHGKAGHRARDRDRRRHDQDRRRSDRRGDRQRGDRDRGRRSDSDGGPRRPHPRNDPNPRLLVSEKPATSPISVPDDVRRRIERRQKDPRPTQPFVRTGSPKGSPGALPQPPAPTHWWRAQDGRETFGSPRATEVAGRAERRATANRAPGRRAEGANLDDFPGASRRIGSDWPETVRASVPAAATDPAGRAAAAERRTAPVTAERGRIRAGVDRESREGRA